MTITDNQLRGIAGSGGKVVTSEGDKIGSIGRIYLDASTGDPEWVTVKTGLLGIAESFVPVHGATLRGGDMVVPYDEATVKHAPRVDPDGSLTPKQEDNLYSYYYGERDSAGSHDVSGPETDDATVPEEARDEEVHADIGEDPRSADVQR
jgi:hypothetical protein